MAHVLAADQSASGQQAVEALRVREVNGLLVAPVPVCRKLSELALPSSRDL